MLPVTYTDGRRGMKKNPTSFTIKDLVGGRYKAGSRAWLSYVGAQVDRRRGHGELAAFLNKLITALSARSYHVLIQSVALPRHGTISTRDASRPLLWEQRARQDRFSGRSDRRCEQTRPCSTIHFAIFQVVWFVGIDRKARKKKQKTALRAASQEWHGSIETWDGVGQRGSLRHFTERVGPLHVLGVGAGSFRARRERPTRTSTSHDGVSVGLDCPDPSWTRAIDRAITKAATAPSRLFPPPYPPRLALLNWSRGRAAGRLDEPPTFARPARKSIRWCGRRFRSVDGRFAPFECLRGGGRHRVDERTRRGSYSANDSRLSFRRKKKDSNNNMAFCRFRHHAIHSFPRLCSFCHRPRSRPIRSVPVRIRRLYFTAKSFSLRANRLQRSITSS
jgi:hypothetical protein